MLHTNQTDKVQKFSFDEMKEYYPAVLDKTRRGAKSRFDDEVFQEAIKQAKENPNYFFKFFEFSHSDLYEVKKEVNSCQSFARSYLKRNGFTNFQILQNQQGNKATIFIMNVVEEKAEEE